MSMMRYATLDGETKPITRQQQEREQKGPAGGHLDHHMVSALRCFNHDRRTQYPD